MENSSVNRAKNSNVFALYGLACCKGSSDFCYINFFYAKKKVNLVF